MVPDFLDFALAFIGRHCRPTCVRGGLADMPRLASHGSHWWLFGADCISANRGGLVADLATCHFAGSCLIVYSRSISRPVTTCGSPAFLPGHCTVTRSIFVSLPRPNVSTSSLWLR